ncbi:MAG: DUF2934 domain-containing protein [Candidatus Angelobacter sp.]
MAAKTSGKTSKSTSKKQSSAQPGSTVTPINRGDLVSGGIRTATNQNEPRMAEPMIVEQIRLRAYELFEQRGRIEGFDQEDWARAEAEVLAKFRRGKSA